MSKYLITPTLLNAYQYYINDEFQSPADSRAKFLKTLSKEKFEPTKDMQKGIDFENCIQLACENKFRPQPKIISIVGCPHGDGGDVEYSETEYDDYSKMVLTLAKIVKGGLWQQVVKKQINVGNDSFLLYGKCDVIKRDTIYDIKFTDNYELGKFQDSSQHLIYLYCTNMPKFQYLISDGKDYWVEDYHNNLDVENKVKSKISDLIGYLENDLEAKRIFADKWLFF